MKNDPYEKVTVLEVMKKGFFSKNLGCGRKKLFSAETKILQSNSSYKSNNESLDCSELLECKKQILNNTLNSHNSKIEIDCNNEFSRYESECNVDKN